MAEPGNCQRRLLEYDHQPHDIKQPYHDGSGTGTYTSSLTGLTANTLYYVRAYATNSVGTAYGNQVTFTTLP